MVKRPVGMYFVLVWFVFFSLPHLQLVRRVVYQYDVRSGIRLFFVVTLIAVIWEGYGLMILNALSRWIGIALFGFWALSSLLKIPMIASPPLPSARNVLNVRIMLGMVALCNIAAIWYMARSSFRTMCVQYCQERKQRKKEKELTKKFV